MQVTATINGYANGSNECAAFAVHSVSENGQDHDRVVPLQPMTINQAELAAAEYACKSVNPAAAPLTDIVIKTCNPYLTGIAEKTGDKWKVVPKTNVDLVNKVRLSLQRFKSFSIKLDPSSELMLDLKSKARSLSKAE